MKMKYEDLLRLKIDIQTTNDRNFMELAILFDKPEFLEWLPKIRDKYNLQTVAPDKYWEVYGELSDDPEKPRKSLDEFDMSLYKDVDGLSDYLIVNESYFPIGGGQDKYQQLETDAAILCHVFKRPPYFIESIIKAIICGSVDGTDFTPTIIHVVENGLLMITTAGLAAPQVVISISPSSTDLEIKEQVAKARHLLKTDKRLTYYKPRIDLINRVRHYREWYWQHLAGKTYKQISQDWTDNPKRIKSESDYDEIRIGRGVTMYKKLLTQ